MQNIIVTTRCSDLRSLGRQALRGQWKTAIFASLIYFVIAVLPSTIFNIKSSFESLNENYGAAYEMNYLEIALSIYSLLVTGPIVLGFCSFTIKLFRRQNPSPAEVFYGFEKFIPAFGLLIVQSFFIFLWSLLFIIPGIIAAFRYAMSFYVLADNPDIGIMGALNESKRLMSSNKMKFFLLQLSFIGWAILASIPAGLGYIFLFPYIEASIVAFYEIASGRLDLNERGKLRTEIEYEAKYQSQAEIPFGKDEAPRSPDLD